jgi:acyl-CoA synthetase (AMP-forming)/AMP-acid ligase II
MVAVSGARVVVASGAVRRLLGEVVRRARPELGARAAEELASAPAELDLEPAPGDLALVQFSSGSTVSPKPVALTHGALTVHVAAVLALLAPTPADRLVSWLPLYHDMGLIGGLLGAAGYPGPAVLLPPEAFLARPALWLRALARHRGTISAAPSFAWAYAAARIPDREVEGLDLSAWRVALDGAEPVSADAARRFGERFARLGFRPESILPVYGLSEAALAVTFTPGARPLRAERVDAAALARDGRVRPGAREVVSVGVPVPGVEVEVRDGDGAPAGEGRLGRIWVRGPSLLREYLGDPGATARTLVAGWLDTGDLGFVRGGELYVHGRARDVVVVRGANHSPEEFEAALTGVPGVRPGCAVAVGHDPDGRGERLLLLVERAGDAAEDGAVAAAARAAVTERTGVTPHVELLAPGALPRTSSGKMRRQEALRRHAAGALAPPSKVTPATVAAALSRSALGYLRAAWGRPPAAAAPEPGLPPAPRGEGREP